MSAVRKILVPDLRQFDLTPADRFRGNPNDRPGRDKLSLVIPANERWPHDRPWRPDHPALRAHPNIARWREDLSELLQTDAGFHRIHLALAREENQRLRIDTRRDEVVDAARDHAEFWIQAEVRRRLEFLRKVELLIAARTRRHRRAREMQLSWMDFVRRHTIEQAARWREIADQRLLAAEGMRDQSKILRLSQLYALTENLAPARLFGRGRPLESVLGDLHAEERRVVSTEFAHWHRTNLAVSMANGGIARGSEILGKPVEALAAELHQPLLDERLFRTSDWHDTAFLVTAPNGALHPAYKQGRLPAAAAAALALPDVDRRTADHWDFRLGNLWVPTPNGGLARFERAGKIHEEASAERALPLIDARTERHLELRAAERYTVTLNGTIARLPAVGDIAPKASADLALPARAEATAAFSDWHAGNLYAPTPNQGYAPLPGHGHSLVDVAADRHERVTDTRTADFDRHHDGQRYAPTPNGGYAPLHGVGRPVEEVVGDFNAALRSEVSDQLLDRRLDNLYAPTANGTWRRIRPVGHLVEHVSAEVDAARKRDNADIRPETTTSKADLGNGRVVPLPAGGRALAEAVVDTGDRREAVKRTGLDAFRRNLAAHAAATETSLLNTHAVAPREDSAQPAEPPAASTGGQAPAPAVSNNITVMKPRR